MSDTKNISADFPFESRYLEIHGSRMHYIDEGEGDPILFLHGNPTSSYLWRNIIPYLTDQGRCIAPDLIGMGKSDQPAIDYHFLDHYKYLQGFIEKMDLRNITLVLHDWGSGLGFHYFANHPDNVKGIAFMEAILRPMRWSEFPAGWRIGFKLMRATGIGWIIISFLNGFVEQVLPRATVRTLTKEEMDRYRAPFPTIDSRKPVRQWPCEIPIDGHPANVHEAVDNYSRKLQSSEAPKLLFHASPGGLIPAETVEWCKENLSNLTTVDIGKGVHYLQEDNPDLIGSKLSEWFEGL